MTDKKARMISKTGNKGFTLIEVMVTVSVLALGTILIQQGLLRSATVLNHYSNLLTVQRWNHERFWASRDSLFYTKDAGEGKLSGSFTQANREFHWTESDQLEGQAYRVTLDLQWNEGNNPVSWNSVCLAAAKKS